MATQPSNVDRIESAADITLTVSKGGGGEPAQTNDNGEPIDQNPDKDGTQTSPDEAQILKIPISRLDRTKDIEINEIRESSLKASGYSVTSISFSGSMMFKGERVHGPDNAPVRIDSLLFDSGGVPNPVSITVTHEISGRSETYEDVLVTSDSYEVQSESETETSYDWVAMEKSTNDPE